MTHPIAYYVLIRGTEDVLLGVDLEPTEATDLLNQLRDDLAEDGLPTCSEIKTRPATDADLAAQEESDRAEAAAKMAVSENGMQ